LHAFQRDNGVAVDRKCIRAAIRQLEHITRADRKSVLTGHVPVATDDVADLGGGIIQPG
jgi:hypothetical protein